MLLHLFDSKKQLKVQSSDHGSNPMVNTVTEAFQRSYRNIRGPSDPMFQRLTPDDILQGQMIGQEGNVNHIHGIDRRNSAYSKAGNSTEGPSDSMIDRLSPNDAVLGQMRGHERDVSRIHGIDRRDSTYFKAGNNIGVPSDPMFDRLSPKDVVLGRMRVLEGNTNHIRGIDCRNSTYFKAGNNIRGPSDGMFESLSSKDVVLGQTRGHESNANHIRGIAGRISAYSTSGDNDIEFGIVPACLKDNCIPVTNACYTNISNHNDSNPSNPNNKWSNLMLQEASQRDDTVFSSLSTPHLEQRMYLDHVMHGHDKTREGHKDALYPNSRIQGPLRSAEPFIEPGREPEDYRCGFSAPDARATHDRWGTSVAGTGSMHVADNGPFHNVENCPQAESGQPYTKQLIHPSVFSDSGLLGSFQQSIRQRPYSSSPCLVSNYHKEISFGAPSCSECLYHINEGCDDHGVTDFISAKTFTTSRNLELNDSADGMHDIQVTVENEHSLRDASDNQSPFKRHRKGRVHLKRFSDGIVGNSRKQRISKQSRRSSQKLRNTTLRSLPTSGVVESRQHKKASVWSRLSGKPTTPPLTEIPPTVKSKPEEKRPNVNFHEHVQERGEFSTRDCAGVVDINANEDIQMHRGMVIDFKRRTHLRRSKTEADSMVPPTSDAANGENKKEQEMQDSNLPKKRRRLIRPSFSTSVERVDSENSAGKTADLKNTGPEQYCCDQKNINPSPSSPEDKNDSLIDKNSSIVFNNKPKVTMSSLYGDKDSENNFTAVHVTDSQCPDPGNKNVTTDNEEESNVITSEPQPQVPDNRTFSRMKHTANENTADKTTVTLQFSDSEHPTRDNAKHSASPGIGDKSICERRCAILSLFPTEGTDTETKTREGPENPSDSGYTEGQENSEKSIENCFRKQQSRGINLNDYVDNTEALLSRDASASMVLKDEPACNAQGRTTDVRLISIEDSRRIKDAADLNCQPTVNGSDVIRIGGPPVCVVENKDTQITTEGIALGGSSEFANSDK
eukprot:TRINITY_DN3665_c0_g1_i1.p1 TRINITY_DN3665_c0_g1~~TRINITY_DN3665_c0_g1_i1.p1  ORF type:complete len:1014 (-),score=178.67 TRINITY_DN3665_c0_g1_i1:200-3241(-)